MDQDFQVFDFYRIFIGDAPITYLLEIIFRTVIMYSYTVFLLRILGKRGMGQLSTLELAIIISFGSAAGDPMLAADMPILHGMVAITTITFLQIGLERLINKNKKIEVLMEGSPNLLVDNGLIQWDCMNKDNLSKEDLFRSLREKEVEHLGQINKAFFETTGRISVQFHPPKKVKPGLSVLPESEVPHAAILETDTPVKIAGDYSCINCGNVKSFKQKENTPKCNRCEGTAWIEATA